MRLEIIQESRLNVLPHPTSSRMSFPRNKVPNKIGKFSFMYNTETLDKDFFVMLIENRLNEFVMVIYCVQCVELILKEFVFENVTKECTTLK